MSTPHERADHGNRLWLLINAEVWYRMMILGQSREDVRLELAPARPRAARAEAIETPEKALIHLSTLTLEE